MFGHIVTESNPQWGGHGNRPVVYALDADKWKCGKGMYKARAGGNGLGINYQNVGYTINTVDRAHIVAVCFMPKSLTQKSGIKDNEK